MLNAVTTQTGWEWLYMPGISTEEPRTTTEQPPVATRELESEIDLPRPSTRRAALGAVAVTLGLTLGALAWVWWRRTQRQDQQTQPELRVATQPPASVVAQPPVSAAVSLPQTPEDLEQLLQSARVWLRMSPQAEDRDIACLVWSWHWRDVPYPWRLHAHDDPSLAQALKIVSSVVATARAEPREPKQSEVPTRAEQPDLSPLTRETATPGYFYRVRAGDELLGDDGIAAAALSEAALELARGKGWPPEKVEARARKLAGKVGAQTAYANLICKGEWNQRRADPLIEGELLWLPPLRRMSLFDRSRSRTIAVEPKRWPDGAKKLEPPPALRGIGVRDGPRRVLVPDEDERASRGYPPRPSVSFAAMRVVNSCHTKLREACPPW